MRAVAADAQPIEIVCIIGFGRSGSTVLDTVLGNHPEAVSLGELANLPTRGWTNNEYCACGVRASECSFWNRVRAAWSARCRLDDLAEYVALQRQFERVRALPRLLREGRHPSLQLERYRELTGTLYQAIAEVSGKSVLIDSSKSPLRALALAGIQGLDVRAVHLLRDPRGVAWSLLKPYSRDDSAGVQRNIASRPAWRTAWEWSVSNSVACVVRWLLPRGHAVRVRYEDLLADPRAALRDIAGPTGLDLDELARRVSLGETLAVGHPIAGNRVRMQGQVRLRADIEWQERLRPADRIAVGVIAGPLMWCFGYGARERS